MYHTHWYTGSGRGKHILILIVSVVIGILIGEWGDWDGHVNRWAEKVPSRYTKSGDAAGIANAFITSCLIMNVGAMVIVGSLAAGLAEDYTMLYTKSLLDFVSGIMLSAAMGIGVMGSAVFILVFQGALSCWLNMCRRFVPLSLLRNCPIREVFSYWPLGLI